MQINKYKKKFKKSFSGGVSKFHSSGLINTINHLFPFKHSKFYNLCRLQIVWEWYMLWILFQMLSYKDNLQKLCSIRTGISWLQKKYLLSVGSFFFFFFLQYTEVYWHKKHNQMAIFLRNFMDYIFPVSLFSF